jgi:peptidyl-prolyl cis-trans isomerase A (cyclophilin A)
MLGLAFAGIAFCQETKEEKAPASPAAPAAPAAAAGTRVALDTSMGKIVIELDEEKAPETSKNFLKYVDDKFFDGTIFHRIIGDFVIQGGGFEIKEEKGTQKATNPPIKNEAKNGLKNLRGTLSMARTPDPNSATSQFFINVVDNANLDPNPSSPHGYAVFAKVVEGMDVIDKMRRVPTTTKVLNARDPVTGESIPQPMPDVPVDDVILKTATRVAK